jgi:glutamate synthase domain-containing protein 3
MGTVDLEAVEEDEDIVELREMIELHKEYTGSTVAAAILDEWPMSIKQFVKVMPTDYKRVLAERKRHDEEVEQTLRDDETGAFVAHAGR